MLDIVTAVHGDDRAFDRHRLQHALRAAGWEFGEIQVGDSEETRQVFALAGITDALGDAGGFELALLPRELALTDEQINRVRMRAKYVDAGLHEFFGHRLIELIACGR